MRAATEKLPIRLLNLFLDALNYPSLWRVFPNSVTRWLHDDFFLCFDQFYCLTIFCLIRPILGCPTARCTILYPGRLGASWLPPFGETCLPTLHRPPPATFQHRLSDYLHTKQLQTRACAFFYLLFPFRLDSLFAPPPPPRCSA